MSQSATTNESVAASSASAQTAQAQEGSSSSSSTSSGTTHSELYSTLFCHRTGGGFDFGPLGIQTRYSGGPLGAVPQALFGAGTGTQEGATWPPTSTFGPIAPSIRSGPSVLEDLRRVQHLESQAERSRVAMDTLSRQKEECQKQIDQIDEQMHLHMSRVAQLHDQICEVRARHA